MYSKIIKQKFLEISCQGHLEIIPWAALFEIRKKKKVMWIVIT